VAQLPRLRVLELGADGGSAWRAEIERLFELDRECFPPGIAYGRVELEKLVRHPSAWTALAEAEGELLGFAVVRTWRGLLHVLTIDVARHSRRQGIGRLLMSWAESRAEALGLAAMRLEVAVDNVTAQKFYKELGFREVGRIENYYPPDIDALILQRTLPWADLRLSPRQR
jgi:[ribosomal protein S18]-alanine N-acetyltransferase